jgi:hypothetical protein
MLANVLQNYHAIGIFVVASLKNGSDIRRHERSWPVAANECAK